MNFISQLATSRRAWLLLATSAFIFELCALYFQYMMNLQPCIMCVYQRLAIFSILFAGVIGYSAPTNAMIRLLAFSLWVIGAIWGLIIALEHVDMQNATFSFMFSCEIIPNFPDWAPLHQWLPMLFEASGDCGDVNWQFLGYSMPEMMTVVYGTYSALFALILGSRIIQVKNI
jgi:disulfide bond formation protein DsbB